MNLTALTDLLKNSQQKVNAAIQPCLLHCMNNKVEFCQKPLAAFRGAELTRPHPHRFAKRHVR